MKPQKAPAAQRNCRSFSYIGLFFIIVILGTVDVFCKINSVKVITGAAEVHMTSPTDIVESHIVVHGNDILVASITGSYIVFGIVGKTGIMMVFGVYTFIFQVGNSIINDIHENEIQKEKMNMRIEQIKSGNVFSTIETHFFYNNMGIIRFMINDNPEKAADIMGKFTKYLRYKTDGKANQSGIIPLNLEIKAVEYYASMKRLQLEDKLQLEYDISADDFPIPVLTVEPLIKCLIRLSVTPLNDVGTIRVKSGHCKAFNLVEISSDAIGTDGANEADAKEMKVTFDAIEKRLKKFGHNEMKVKSDGERGIVIEILFAKEQINGGIDNANNIG